MGFTPNASMLKIAYRGDGELPEEIKGSFLNSTLF